MEIFTNKERKRFPLQKINNNDGIFEIKKCKCNCAGDLEEGNEIMYIGAKKDDNGFMKMVAYEEKIISNGNCIIFICDGEGSVGYSNYMDKNFIGSTTLAVGYNENLNSYIGMFLVTLLDLERKKYSYGRKYGSNLGNAKIKLPVDEIGNPDWKFMENYIKTLKSKPISTKNVPGKIELKTNEWKEFVFNKIFTLKGGFYNKKPEHSIDGNIPFLASTESNNGVTEYYSIDDIKTWDKVGNIDNTLDKKMYEGNCIAVTVNGSVCNAFYQPNQFTCSHDITAFYGKGYNLNKYTANFLCSVIMHEKYRWSYGRKPHDVKKFGKSIIRLPIMKDLNGNAIIDNNKQFCDEGYIPDREFMENYIKNLPYGDRI